jgi:hypothetical protein
VRIGFLHVDKHTESSEEAYLCARAMVASAREVMPYAHIVQFTDMTTKRMKGVDAVRRKPSEPMGLLRMRHCAGVDGKWLFVDTDVIFQKPVGPVFKSEFDIAVTSRNWSHVKHAVGFSQRMPFNTGVVFSRCAHFWGEVYTRLRNLEPELQEFLGEQQIICEVAADTDRYRIKYLKGSIYNYPPEVPGLNPSSAEMEAAAAILHYKGEDRKALMLQRTMGARRCA